MTIGSILLQPQPVDRFSRFSYDDALGDDALAIFQKIAMNPEWLDPLIDQVGDRMDGFIADLQAHVEARMFASQAAMDNLLNPLLSGIGDLFDDDLEIQTVGDLVPVILDLADRLAGFIESISLEQLLAFVEELLDLLFEGFGFSIEYLRDLICRFVDIVIDAMETVVVGASNEYIELQLQVAACARRVKRDILSEIAPLEIDSESIARLLLGQLREFGLEKIQEKAHCVAGRLRELTDAGTRIYDLAKAVDGGASVGALKTIPPVDSGMRYCWYASWLYRNRRRNPFWYFMGSYVLPLVPENEVWISADGTQLILRHVTESKDMNLFGDQRMDEILYQSPDGAPINWYDAPQFAQTSGADEHFTFTGVLSANAMENWTLISSILVNMSRFSGHAIHAAEPGNHVTHGILSAWHVTRMFGEPLAGAPLTSWIRDKWGFSMPNRVWIDILFKWMPVFGGSFEGYNKAGDGFFHWATLIGDDSYDSFLIYLWPTLAHEGVLSILTLINHKGTAYTDFGDSGKPKNFEYSYPLTNVWLVFFSWLQNRVAMPRHRYSYPGESSHKDVYWANWGYSLIFGALAGISGELCGWAFSRQVSPRRLLIQLGWGAYKGFGFNLFPSNYFWNEGETRGGRYNPNRRKNTAGDWEYYEDMDFEGYGNPATSPYRLPIAEGRPIFVGQANQGMFSHFIDDDGTIQVYAADFAHAFQEMVVAVRDGTVVDYFDWITDDIEPNDDEQIAAGLRAVNSGFLISNLNGNQSGFNFNPSSPSAGAVPSWNFIIIQHNDPFGTETAEQKAHDKDEGGAGAFTYAVYGHGANGGVRAAFAGRSPTVAPADIIGTEVKRGENIMQAGDTGVSFHNHLHLHIRPGPRPLPPLDRADPAQPEVITSGTLNATGRRTLPIVFKDATHPLKPDGRLYHLTWYRSGNRLEP